MSSYTIETHRNRCFSCPYEQYLDIWHIAEINIQRIQRNVSTFQRLIRQFSDTADLKDLKSQTHHYRLHTMSLVNIIHCQLQSIPTIPEHCLDARRANLAQTLTTTLTSFRESIAMEKTAYLSTMDEADIAKFIEMKCRRASAKLAQDDCIENLTALEVAIIRLEIEMASASEMYYIY